MRQLPLTLVLALGCVTSPEVAPEPDVVAPAEAAAVGSPADAPFFLGTTRGDLHDVVAYDTRALVAGARARTAAVCTTCVTGTGTAAVDGDSDGYVASQDCNDANSSIYPGAPETPGDGVDQDCDGKDDCYTDGDGDGFGSTVALDGDDMDCDDAGEASVSTDCDDAVAEVNPDADEVCNTIDDDCDTKVDDDDDSLVQVTYYADDDADGYGDPDDSELGGCTPITAHVANDEDCDDADGDVNPGETEIVGNGTDDDCDPSTSDVATDDTDSDEPADSDTDGSGGGDKGGGCNCSTGAPVGGGGGLATALAGLGALLVRRRRR